MAMAVIMTVHADSQIVFISLSGHDVRDLHLYELTFRIKEHGRSLKSPID